MSDELRLIEEDADGTLITTWKLSIDELQLLVDGLKEIDLLIEG